MRALACSMLATAMFSIWPWDSSWAGDGVLEINQTCATETGCFPQDDPGFPVLIVNSGSYALTSNLTVPAEVDAISNVQPGPVFLDDISIDLDLNGFTISSTTECGGKVLSCNPTNGQSGFGVFFFSIDIGNFHIHNGTIKGMAATGVDCSADCLVHDLIVANSGVNGLRFSGNARNVMAHENGNDGIVVDDFGTVEQCISRGNVSQGFSGPGIFSGNVARNNGSHAFAGTDGAVYFGNKVRNADPALSTGFVCSACTMQSNVVVNSYNGVDFGHTASAFGGNIITATNSALLNSDSAVQSSPNICNGAPCP